MDDEDKLKEFKENTENIFMDLEETVSDLLNDTKNINRFINHENDLNQIKIIENNINDQ